MATISATIRINDAFSGPLNKLKSGLESAQSGFNKLKNKLSGNGGVFNDGTKSANGLFKSMLGANLASSAISKSFDVLKTGAVAMAGELNEASIAWQTFDGNMKQLDKSPAQIQAAKSQMQKFAQQTIYSASDMSSTYAQLAAVGTKNTAQLVKGFGGLAASADDPKQAMKTLSEQATQMAAKPKVQWQDFKLMLEQAPGGIAAVAKSMGTSTRGLIKEVQAGTVSTDKFLAAIAKTGTNANFSRMATQYKTIGQAMDGMKETLANKLQPAFDKVSKVGIDWVSQLTDRLDGVNFDKIGDSIANSLGKIDLGKALDGIGNVVSGIMPLFNNLGNAINQAFTGFSSSGALSNIGNTIKNIGTTIGDLFNKLKNLGGNDLFSGIGQTIGNVVNAILPVIDTLVSAVSNAMVSLAPIIGTIGSALANAFIMVAPVVQNVISLISSMVSTIAPLISTVVTSIVSLVGPILSQITSTVSAAIQGLQAGLAPLASAFSQLQSAAAPLAPILSAVGQALGQLGGATLAGVALGIGVIVDALTSVVSIAAGVVNAVKAIAQGFHALGDALTGNFSGAKRDIEDAKNAIDDMKSSFGNIGNAIGNGATANMMKQFSQIGSAAKKTASEVNGTKFEPQVDTASANKQIQELGKSSKVKVGAEVDIANLNKTINNLGNKKINAKLDTGQVAEQAKSKPLTQKISLKYETPKMPKLQTIKAPKVGTPKVPTPKMPKNLKQIKAPKVGTPKVPTPKTPKNLKQIKAPKVGTPKVPTPKMPGTLKQIPAPKVGTPRVPTPKMPHLGTIPTPKVGTPHVPTPALPHLGTIPAPKVGMPHVPVPPLPHLGTIPAPHVARPSMAGVVSAVSAGMARAAAAARAGGAALSSAVRGAVNQAVAAGRAGAGAMYGVGVQIGAGLANGIRSQIGAVAAAANALIAQAERASRAAAKVHSPSRVWFGIGDFIGQGLALGINSTAGEVAQASAGIINQASDITPTINAPNVGYNSSMGYGVGGIGPNTYGTTNNYQQSTNAPSRVVNINSGAITVNSTGDAKTDVDAILTELEQRILNAGDKSLY